jgi:hypothetical protein
MHNKKCSIQSCICCLSEIEIDNALEEYCFQVPYDGSSEFYDKEKMKHFKAGVDFVLNHIKSNCKGS